MEQVVVSNGEECIIVSSDLKSSGLQEDFEIKVESEEATNGLMLESRGVKSIDNTSSFEDSSLIPVAVVESFLLANPEFLDDFVTNHVPRGQIEKWLALKEEPVIDKKINIDQAQSYVDASFSEVKVLSVAELNDLNSTPSIPTICDQQKMQDVKIVRPAENGASSAPPFVSVKTNRRKLSKPNRVKSDYNTQNIQESPTDTADLPGDYFIERCNQCDKAFFSYQSFKLHSCYSKSTQRLSCSHCSAMFRDMGLFTKHVSSKKCNKKDCNAQFFCAEKYNVHVSSHSESHTHQCQHCDAAFNEKSYLQVHLQSQHGIRPFQCEKCGKRFTQSGNLKRHIRLHSGERPYKCSICQRAFSDQSHLKYHLKQHTGQKPFRCTQCDKAFLTATNLRQHAATHLDRAYRCDDCGKDFRTNSELKKHTESHGAPKSLACVHCSRIFSKPSLLKSHLFDAGNKPYSCKHCSVVLPCAGRIKSHSRTHTIESTKYKCPDCDMLFDKGANLKSHIRTHLQFRPFQCNECGKCFTQSGNLRRHLRIHSGEKPFKCSECSLAFSDQSHLKYHSIQAHSPVRPFPCSFCGKGFITSSKLKSHLRVHDPQKTGKGKVKLEIDTPASNGDV